MVDLLPVRGWHPNTRTFDPDRLIAPVYDTLGPKEHRKFDVRKHNAATFTSRRTDMPVGDFLERASRNLKAAIGAGAFVKDDEPGLYVYSIQYQPSPDILETIEPQDRRAGYLLLGIVGALAMDGASPMDIAPHEQTFSDRVEERVSLTERTGMHFAPIMAGYNPGSHAINDLIEDLLGMDRRNLDFNAKTPPLVEAAMDGSVHRLWRIGEPETLSRLHEMLAGERALILDGHHRFEAARRLIERGHRVRPLTMLVEVHDRALLLLPWHRVLPPSLLTYESFMRKARASTTLRLEEKSQKGGIPRVMELLRGLRKQGDRGFVAVGPDSLAVVKGLPSEEEGSDYATLHGFLEKDLGLDPEGFSFVRSPGEAVSAMRAEGGVAFLLPHLSIEGVEREAFARHFMAQKSTMFVPKVAEGVIFASAANDLLVP